MRIDKLLWFLRLAKTRSIAQAMVEHGHMRLNGRRVERAAHRICVGDILVLPLPSGVRCIEVLVLPERRGPAAEAQQCYRTLDAGGSNPIAAPETRTEYQGDSSP